MKVRFWGVRGSIPTPGPETVKYGGNTTCIEVRLDDGRLIIIGAGSGIRALGNRLVKHDMKKGPLDIDLFLSHTHWDHIMGFPFFIPIFIPGNKIRVHGPVNIGDEGLENIFALQMSYNYFPMRADELAADISYEILTEKYVALLQLSQIKSERDEFKKFKEPHNCGCGADSFATRCNECGGYRKIGHGG